MFDNYSSGSQAFLFGQDSGTISFNTTLDEWLLWEASLFRGSWDYDTTLFGLLLLLASI